MTLVIEPATPADFPAIADLTVSTYVSQGWAGPEYQQQLADVAGRAAQAQLLVARLDDALVGSVAVVLDGEFGEVTDGPDEAAFRMLVVDPAARGRGIGEALVLACLQRAADAGRRWCSRPTRGCTPRTGSTSGWVSPGCPSATGRRCPASTSWCTA